MEKIGKEIKSKAKTKSKSRLESESKSGLKAKSAFTLSSSFSFPSTRSFSKKRFALMWDRNGDDESEEGVEDLEEVQKPPMPTSITILFLCLVDFLDKSRFKFSSMFIDVHQVSSVFISFHY